MGVVIPSPKTSNNNGGGTPGTNGVDGNSTFIIFGNSAVAISGGSYSNGVLIPPTNWSLTRNQIDTYYSFVSYNPRTNTISYSLPIKIIEDVNIDEDRLVPETGSENQFLSWTPDGSKFVDIPTSPTGDGNGLSESEVNKLIEQSVFDVSKTAEGTSNDYVIPAPPENSSSNGSFETSVNLNTIGVTNTEVPHDLQLSLDLNSLGTDGSIATYQFSIKYKNKNNVETTVNVNNRYSADQGFVNLFLKIPDVYINETSPITLIINYLNTGGSQTTRVHFISVTLHEIGVLHAPIETLIDTNLLNVLPLQQRDAINNLLNYSLAEIQSNIELNTAFRELFVYVEKPVNDPIPFNIRGTSDILTTYAAVETGNVFIETFPTSPIQVRINNDNPITWTSARNSIGLENGRFEWEAISLQKDDILRLTTSHTKLVLKLRQDLDDLIERVDHLDSIITENVRQVFSTMTFSREKNVTLKNTALYDTLISPIIKINQTESYAIPENQDDHIIFTANNSNFRLNDPTDNLISRVDNNYQIHKPEYTSIEMDRRVNLTLTEAQGFQQEAFNITLSPALKLNEAFSVQIRLFENDNPIGDPIIVDFLSNENSKTITGSDNANQPYTIVISKTNLTTLGVEITANNLDLFYFQPFAIRDVSTVHVAQNINIPIVNGVLFVLDRQEENTLIRYSLYGVVRQIYMEKTYGLFSINNSTYLGYSGGSLSNQNITDLYSHRLDTYLGLQEVVNSEHNVITFNASIKAETTLLHIGDEEGNLGIASKLRALTVNPTLFPNRTNSYIIEFLRLDHAEIPHVTTFNDDGTFLIPEGDWIICATLKITNNTTSSSSQRRLFTKFAILQASAKEGGDDTMITRHAQTTYIRYSSNDTAIPDIELFEGWVTIAGGVESNGKNRIGIGLDVKVQNADTTGTINLSNAHCHAFRIP